MVLACVSTIAAADSIEVMVGPEIRSHLSKPDPYPEQLDDGASGDSRVGALVATLAYRLPEHFSAGVHASVSRRSYSTVENGNMRSFRHDFSTIPFDIGFTLQYAPIARLWAAPWVGAHLTSRRTTERYCQRVPGQDGPWPCTTADPTADWTGALSFGITAGVNIWCHGGHCVAALIDLQSSVTDYAALSFGVVYHR
jgi:hypothetical protein